MMAIGHAGQAGGMPLADVAPEIALVVGSVCILLFALIAPRRLQAWAAAGALVTVAATTALTLHLAGTGQRLTFGDTYAVDGGAVAAKLIILGVTALVIGLSLEWFRGDARQAEYYSLILLSALGAVLLAGAADLMELVLGVLLSSATGYVLAAYHRTSRRSAEAAMKYYLLGALTNGLLVFGAVLLFGLGGTTTFAGLGPQLAHTDPTALAAGVALLVVGLAFKLGAVPAHTWVPDVADGAPAPVSAFVTVVPKLGALAALGRLALILPDSGVGWRPLIAVLAALTMTVGNVAALRQNDVRRLLGWSAVSQAGYALMAVVALGRSALATSALFYFLAAYAFAAVASFGVVVALRGRAPLAAYGGLARTNPWLAAALAVSFFSFIGIPPTAGFAGKVALFAATIESKYAWLTVVAAANTVISLAYYGRVLAPMFFEPAASEAAGTAADNTPGTSRSDPFAAWAVSLSVLAVLAGGIAAQVIFAALRSARLLPG
jgi:NADH-quinone oxidoreductase subunit N